MRRCAAHVMGASKSASIFCMRNVIRYRAQKLSFRVTLPSHFRRIHRCKAQMNNILDRCSARCLFLSRCESAIYFFESRTFWVAFPHCRYRNLAQFANRYKAFATIRDEYISHRARCDLRQELRE